MATSFAAQLRTIAQTSTHDLNLKARRLAHSESLIFPKEIAVKQDFSTLYSICVSGFHELCQLDTRFEEYGRNLFSEQSIEMERDTMTAKQIEGLDSTVAGVLMLLGSRVLLRPGVRCLEWLVRKFRVHVHNVGVLLCAVLPWHEQQIMRNVLNIVSKDKLVDTWKWLRPHKEVNGGVVPKHAVVYAMTNNGGFFDVMNGFLISSAQLGLADRGLTRFWTALVVEAVNARLGKAKSGKREVQRQRMDDLLLKVLPLISDGAGLEQCPDVVVACLTLSIVIAGTGLLEDKVLDKLMETASQNLGSKAVNMRQVLITLAILAAQKDKGSIPSRVTRDLMGVKDLFGQLEELRPQYSLQQLLHGALRGCLKTLQKPHMDDKLNFIRKVVVEGASLVDQSELPRWITTVALHANATSANDEAAIEIRQQLLSMLQQLQESQMDTKVFATALMLTKQAGVDLEVLLQTTIETQNLQVENHQDGGDVAGSSAGDEAEGRRKLVEDAAKVESFLSTHSSTVFAALTTMLQSCIAAGKTEHFSDSQQLYFGLSGTRYLSFLVRVACTDAGSKRRAAATQLLNVYLEKEQQKHDCQALLPYITILLSDPATEVRSAAVALVTTIAYFDGKDGDGELLTLYSSSKNSELPFSSIKDLSRLLEQMYSPTLAECELDRHHICFVVSHALNGSAPEPGSNAKHVEVDLKKSLRVAFYQTLLNAINMDQLLSMKVKLLQLLADVPKVGSVTKIDALHNVLEYWMRQSQDNAESAASADSLSTREMDDAMATMISGRDTKSIDAILEVSKTLKYDVRLGFVDAIFDRLQQLWKGMAVEVQIVVAQLLFEFSFLESSVFARAARATLSQLPLSTTILKNFVTDSIANTPSEVDGPSPKRRRTSHGRAPPSKLAEALSTAIPRLSLTLELIEGSKPESRPDLVPSLFDILLVFRRIRGQSQPVSPYLMNLCLSSINSILLKQRSMRRPDFDMSAIRADVITDLVRSTDNIQVQASAVQLLASLAALSPEKIIHSIMPVFTFMGNDVMSRNDDHSINVVDQAIDDIIPPLVASLKKQDPSSLIKATSGLLSSFVSAYDHIAAHRRVKLYQHLLTRLGKDEFGYVLMVKLAVGRDDDQGLPAFFEETMQSFSPLERLATYRNLLMVIEDIVSGRFEIVSNISPVSASSSEMEKGDFAVLALDTASDLLDSKFLAKQVRRLEKISSEQTHSVEEELKVCLYKTLASVRDSRELGGQATKASRQCLTCLLQLLSSSQLINLLPALLDEVAEEDQDLKALALRVLAAQLKTWARKDPAVAETAIALLTKLQDLLTPENDAVLMHAAIQCIDQITDTHGRSNVDAIGEMAGSLATNESLVGRSSELDMALIVCLTTMIETVKEAAVPTVTPILESVIAILNGQQNGVKTVQLYNAACSLVESIATHVPYMVDEDAFVRVVESLAGNDIIVNNEAAHNSLHETLQVLAQKLDTATLVASLQALWQKPERSTQLTQAILEILSTTLTQHSKSSVLKSANAISLLITSAFDKSGSDVDGAETKALQMLSTKGAPADGQIINDIAIKFIYKLNDTAFRPIFESWIEWADTESRQVVMLKFLLHFFETLKSIVTSYAGYIIEPATTILSSFAARKSSDITAKEKTLYCTLLEALKSSFTNDADAFFANPAHFTPLSTNLLAQLSLASNKSLRPLIFSHAIPTLVALASAIQDTPQHLLSVNHFLCQLRHSDSSHVRLASIETQIAFTQDEDVGDEWISNVVSGTNNGDVGKDGGGSGETMIYVNEMLEDDDEEVEGKVRGWVRMLRERVGEDVFEF